MLRLFQKICECTFCLCKIQRNPIKLQQTKQMQCVVPTFTKNCQLFARFKISIFCEIKNLEALFGIRLEIPTFSEKDEHSARNPRLFSKKHQKSRRTACLRALRKPTKAGARMSPVLADLPRVRAPPLTQPTIGEMWKRVSYWGDREP